MSKCVRTNLWAVERIVTMWRELSLCSYFLVSEWSKFEGASKQSWLSSSAGKSHQNRTFEHILQAWDLCRLRNISLSVFLRAYNWHSVHSMVRKWLWRVYVLKAIPQILRHCCPAAWECRASYQSGCRPLWHLFHFNCISPSKSFVHSLFYAQRYFRNVVLLSSAVYIRSKELLIATAAHHLISWLVMLFLSFSL